jgi:hypothetical protein
MVDNCCLACLISLHLQLLKALSSSSSLLELLPALLSRTLLLYSAVCTGFTGARHVGLPCFLLLQLACWVISLMVIITAALSRAVS